MNRVGRIAYFSMELGLDPSLPTYSGGLGILAGDTIRTAADLRLPMVGVSLLARRGYFHQRLDATGWQTEEPVHWVVDDYLAEVPERVTVLIEERHVRLRAWKHVVKGCSGYEVSVYFLDADLPENTESDRALTHHLYGGDATYRLCQEVILGVGGVRMLREMGYDAIERYHMNEGHAALLVLELLAEHAKKAGEDKITDAHVQKVRDLCVFTTHTPVPAGHDQFPLDLVHRVLGPAGPFIEREEQFCCEGTLNLTYLALASSRYINGVAKKHREVSQQMFAGYQVDSITNGIHVATWASTPIQTLFDRYIPGWRGDNPSLRYAMTIPLEELWQAHRIAKRSLLEYVNRACNTGMDLDVLTLGFARRATPYKRPSLLFCNVDRLKQITREVGALQIVYSGKAHPHDQRGKEIIQQIHRVKDELRDTVKIAYLPNYDMALGKLITAGADVWLNTPQPPMEASGTSGMKAAINGVPSLSVLDGWWIEGCIEGVTGWSIGIDGDPQSRKDANERDSMALYDKLEKVIMPAFYENRDGFASIMRHAIALNGSFFNTERMLNQYIAKAYF